MKISHCHPVQHLVEVLSFGSKIHQLVEVINSEIAAPQSIVYRPISHPAGFSNLIEKRRLTVVEAYVRLIAHSDNDSYSDRIEALQTLMHYIQYGDSTTMPINMARVQIALMKNAVKMRGNRQAQLELMSDFMWASTGKRRVIKQLLNELDLIEVDETPQNDDVTVSWDDHLHDSMTEGRKSPTQLVLDAFIKGISRITISYYDFDNRKNLEEIFLASRILNIRVQVAIAFSVGDRGKRHRYLFIPPNCWTFEALCDFMDRNQSALLPFLNGVRENKLRRQSLIQRLLSHFNECVLPDFNQPYQNLEALVLSPITWEDIVDSNRHGQMNRIHLGLIVYERMSEVCQKRVLYLKSLLACAEPDSDNARELATRCQDVEKAYHELTPSLCAQKYIASAQIEDYDSVFHDENDVLPQLAACGAYVAYIRICEYGTADAVQTVMDHYEHITDIEGYNLVAVQNLGQEPYVGMARLIRALHQNDVEGTRQWAHQLGAKDRPIQEYEKICAVLQQRPFYIRCASDSVGWSSRIPGMGFFPQKWLSTKRFKSIQNSGHQALPREVAEILTAHREKEDEMGVYQLSTMALGGEWGSCDRIMAKQQGGIRLFWRYLNINVRCLIKMAIGFVPALYLGVEYAILWFVLTASRNAIVDLIAASGIGPKNWKLSSIDRENLCTSLFFTGFSVPIMSAAKYGFDVLWTGPLGMEAEGFAFTLIKFCVIALANGTYLATHNTFRGFEKSAIRGNFFRSILSWPLATCMSFFLTPLGVPDVVQAKMASEIVAGCIEGSVKYRKHIRQTRNALLEIYRQLNDTNAVNAIMARLDVLYFWRHIGLGHRALERFLKKDHLSGLSKEDCTCIEQGDQQITNAFADKRNLEQMTYTTLQYYPKEAWTALTGLARDNYKAFQAWLERVKNKE